MAEVVLQGVEKSFSGKVACSGIDLSVNKGEFFTFLGPSGCGKTTILRLIAGFITPQKGAIFISGEDITQLPAEKRKVGMVFQNYSLFPYLNVRQNIEYGLKIQKKTSREIRDTVEKYMEMVGLSGFGERKITELSGGEQQRVALARSLAVEPTVLLLDEPLSNLDARLRDKMRAELKALQRELGITTVFVTHDQTEALTLSDRIAVFNQGAMVQTGSPLEIYNNPRNSFVAGFVGDTNLLEMEGKDGSRIMSSGMEFQVGNCKEGKFISIRPQDIIISKKQTEAANCFAGHIEEMQLNGVWVDYSVRIGGTSLRAAALNSINAMPEAGSGETVFISIPEDSIKVLAE